MRVRFIVHHMWQTVISSEVQRALQFTDMEVRKMRKQFLFYTLTVVLVIVLAGSVCGVAFGKPQHAASDEGKAYRILEEVYLEQVRDVLEEEGLASAGVTLTYERDREGFRSYTLQIHHHRFEGFEQEQLNRLEGMMEDLFFKGEDCGVKMQFWA